MVDQDDVVAEEPADGWRLQLVRLRLHGLPRRVHVAREQGPTQTHGFWSGAERIFVANGRVIGAYSAATLIRQYEAAGGEAPHLPPTLTLDVRRAQRALGRAEVGWSGEIRGTYADVDDLLFDTAYSVGDQPAAEKIKDPAGFHAQYNYIWGTRDAPLAAAARQATWSSAVEWFIDRLLIVDRWERRFLTRR